MKISEIKTLLANKLVTMEAQKLNAMALGDIESLDRITLDIEETKQTINQLW